MFEAIVKLIEEHGGSARPANAVQGVARTPSDGDFDAFHRRQDGREEYMRGLVWASVLNLRRQSADPSPEEVNQAYEGAWATYHRNVVSRLPSADLDAEGRGARAFEEKWHAAMRKWNREVAEEAAKEPLPAPDEIKESLPGSGDLVITSTEFVSRFVRPRYILDGIIQQAYLYTLTGKTGAGKTAVALYIATRVARGLPVGRKTTRKGSVLYLAGENPDDLRARYMVLAEREGFDISEMPIHWVEGVVDIKAEMPRIRAAAENIPDLVLTIVDTSAAYFTGDDDNSNAQKRDYADETLRPLTRLPGRPAVLVPDHPIKNASKENLVPAGGGQFLNAVDGNLTLWAETPEQSLLHHAGKFRGPEFEPLTFKLETAFCDLVVNDEGELMPSVIASPIGEFEAEAQVKQQETDENVLLAIIATNSPLSFGQMAHKANWVSKDGQPAKSKVSRLCHTLHGHKMLTKVRDHYRITQAGRKEIGFDDE